MMGIVCLSGFPPPSLLLLSQELKDCAGMTDGGMGLIFVCLGWRLVASLWAVGFVALDPSPRENGVRMTQWRRANPPEPFGSGGRGFTYFF